MLAGQGNDTATDTDTDVRCLQTNICVLIYCIYNHNNINITI